MSLGLDLTAEHAETAEETLSSFAFSAASAVRSYGVQFEAEPL